MKRTTKLRLSGACFALSLILCLTFTKASGQFVLQVHPVDKDSAFIHSLKLQSAFRTKDQLNKYVDQLPSLLQARGYATASIDSVFVDSTTTRTDDVFRRIVSLGFFEDIGS
jgi:outer membrane protein assembly factor BamA